MVVVTYFAKQGAGKPVFVNFVSSDANLTNACTISQYDKQTRQVIDIDVPKVVPVYRHIHNFVDIVKSETARTRNLHRAKSCHDAKLHAMLYNMLHNMRVIFNKTVSKEHQVSFNTFIVVSLN